MFLILSSRPRPVPNRSGGFTMIEVLVALVVTAVGLLGLAKMQALAVSSTKESGSRALIALQAGALTGVMYANKAYWAAGSPSGAPASFNMSGTTVSDSALGTAQASCASKCTPVQLAAYDVQSWAAAMNQQFPTYNATVTCGTALPVNCKLYITWSETLKSISSETATGATGTNGQVQTQSFSVYVQP